MKKTHIGFFLGSAIFLCAIATRSAIPYSQEQVDDLFDCKAQAMDSVIAEQTQAGFKYSEQDQKSLLSIYTDACVERSMYEYTGPSSKHFPFIFDY